MYRQVGLSTGDIGRVINLPRSRSREILERRFFELGLKSDTLGKSLPVMDKNKWVAGRTRLMSLTKRRIRYIEDKILMGIWKYMIGISPGLMKRKVPERKKKFIAHLGFMTGELRRVHHFVVRELPYTAKPLAP